MKAEGVTNVIALLAPDEYATFYGPPDSMCQIYRKAGINCLCQSMFDADASTNIFAFLHDVEARNEKVVAHCTGGIGRAGRVAAGWLMER